MVTRLDGLLGSRTSRNHKVKNDNPKRITSIIIFIMLISVLYANVMISADPGVINISLDLPDVVNQDEEIVITAFINDQNGNPLQYLNVEFYRTTTFGKLKIGEGVTDADGKASILHKITYAPYNGTDEIEAAFLGSSSFEAVSKTGYMTINFNEVSEVLPEYSFHYNEILKVIILVVIMAWIAYGAVMYLILRIPTEGKKTHTRHRNE